MLKSLSEETNVGISNITKKRQSASQNELQYNKTPFLADQTDGNQYSSFCIRIRLIYVHSTFHLNSYIGYTYKPFLMLNGMTPMPFNKADKEYQTQLPGRVLYNGYKIVHSSSRLSSLNSNQSVSIRNVSREDKELQEISDISFYNPHVNKVS